jgi:hypothetical protein
MRPNLTNINLETFVLEKPLYEKKKLAGMSLDGTLSKLCPAALHSMKNGNLYIKNSNTCDTEKLDLNMFEFLLWLM